MGDFPHDLCDVYQRLPHILACPLGRSLCLGLLCQQEEQLLKVLSSTKSSTCESCKGARRGDLLEIEYTGRLQDGKVFDGSNIKVSPLAPNPWLFMPTFYCHRDVYTIRYTRSCPANREMERPVRSA